MSKRPKAAVRHRKQAAPLEKWRREVREIERDVRQHPGATVTVALTPEAVVDEVVGLADPHAVDGLDVVIPGNRPDLARRWIEARLAGRGDTPADWLALAREIAPLPDEHLLYRGITRGRPDYQSTDRLQDEITKAAKGFFKRLR